MLPRQRLHCFLLVKKNSYVKGSQPAQQTKQLFFFLLPATGVVTALSKGGATMFGGGAGDKGWICCCKSFFRGSSHVVVWVRWLLFKREREREKTKKNKTKEFLIHSKFMMTLALKLSGNNTLNWMESSIIHLIELHSRICQFLGGYDEISNLLETLEWIYLTPTESDRKGRGNNVSNSELGHVALASKEE